MAGVIQAAHPLEDRSAPPAHHHAAALTRMQQLIAEAASRQCQVLCLPALSTGPYLGFETDPRWRELAEPLAEGPTLATLAPLAREHAIVLVVPLLAIEGGATYHAAGVLDADGQLVGVTRQVHVPRPEARAWEASYFKGATQLPAVIRTRYAAVGLLLGEDRRFPEGARALAQGGAELVFTPCAAPSGLSEALWGMEGPELAARHRFFVGAGNRLDPPCRGQSYWADRHGELLGRASPDRDEVLIAELDLEAT